jgi:hypothetical protein
VRVADGDQPVVHQHHEREGAAHLGDRVDHRLVDVAGARPRVQVQHHLGVARGLEDGAVADELVAQLARVHQVAVVGDGNLAVRRTR